MQLDTDGPGAFYALWWVFRIEAAFVALAITAYYVMRELLR